MKIYVMDLPLFSINVYIVESKFEKDDGKTWYVLKCVKGSDEGWRRNIPEAIINRMDEDLTMIVANDIDNLYGIYKSNARLLMENELRALKEIVRSKKEEFKNG